MAPPIPSWSYFVDDFPIAMIRAGVRDATPIPLHVIIDNSQGDLQPCAFSYSRHDAKLIAIALSKHHEERMGLDLEG